jgi:polysaccharide chain length determinant protein (PEP-CTERM system associated)
MQTPQEYTAVNRRPLDVEDYIEILRRHRGWIWGPLFAGLVLAVVVAFLWPDTYISTAVLRITPSQVSERLMPTNVSTEMAQRISSMVTQIESRSVLTNILNNLNLYPAKRKRVPDEDLIEEMQKSIKVTPMASFQAGRASTAFALSFAYSDRFVAQKVALELVRRLTDENERSRYLSAAATTDFLKEQFEAARQTLDDIEKKITDFRVRNSGRLPDQLSANLQQLHTLETQFSGVQGSMSRIGQEKLLLETQLKSYVDQKSTLKSPAEEPRATARNERLAQLDREVAKMEMDLANLKEHYRESHPDVRRVVTQLGFLKKQRDAALKEQAERPPEPPAPAPRRNPAQDREEQGLDARIAQLKTLIDTKDMEMRQLIKEQARLDTLMKSYQGRIDASPLGEKEYADLTRDRESAKRRYDELTQKRSMSEMATAQENRKLGETLEVLDSATLPQNPAQPNRWMIIAVGTGLGLLLGGALAGAREVKDTSLKNLKDVRAYSRLTILGSIPLLEDDFVVRRRRRINGLLWATAGLVGVLIMTGSVYWYVVGKA